MIRNFGASFGSVQDEMESELENHGILEQFKAWLLRDDSQATVLTTTGQVRLLLYP